MGMQRTRSDIMREVANIPDEEVVMTCVAMAIPTTAFLPKPCKPIASRTAISCIMLALRTERF